MVRLKRWVTNREDKKVGGCNDVDTNDVMG